MMKKIWIVDDDEEMCRAVMLMLTLLNFEARYILDARLAARELMEKTPPDLLVLDINMPEVSGVDLLEFLRLREEYKHIPVIMLSTEAADVLVDKTLEMGANAYVTKPVALEELEQAIDKAFRSHGIIN